MRIGRATRSGHIDGYEVVDRDQLFRAIEEQGYTLERRAGRVQTFHDAL